MTELLPPDRRRLLYRATHRGFKEADLLFGHFARENLPIMTDNEVAELAYLLDAPDRDLFAWVTGDAPTPANYEGPVMEKMKAFDVAPLIVGQKS